jgi:hypothetical protein
MRGPIDFIIVGFEGNKFDGSIMEALTNALDKGTIGLIELAMVSKDASGSVTKLAISDLGDDYLVDLESYVPDDAPPVDQADIDEIAELLENNTAAGLLVVEHLWAKPLKQAIIDANGVLVADGRIHPEAALELNDAK